MCVTLISSFALLIVFCAAVPRDPEGLPSQGSSLRRRLIGPFQEHVGGRIKTA